MKRTRSLQTIAKRDGAEGGCEIARAPHVHKYIGAATQPQNDRVLNKRVLSTDAVLIFSVVTSDRLIQRLRMQLDDHRILSIRSVYRPVQ